MAIPSVEQLDQLSREDLLALVKQLMQIIDQQQKRIEELEAEIAKFRQPPHLKKLITTALAGSETRLAFQQKA